MQSSCRIVNPEPLRPRRVAVIPVADGMQPKGAIGSANDYGELTRHGHP